MKKTLQEYRIDDTALYEWLPWGGLIHPAVIRNKDESLMGFLRYKKTGEDNIELSDGGKPMQFVNGWALWTEQQNFDTATETILTVVWNPFFNRDSAATNTLNGKTIGRRETEIYFFSVLLAIEQSLSKHIEICVMKNEEILSFLASTISMRQEQIPMPDIPLYLDVTLSQVEFKMLTNQIKINKQNMAIVTVPALGQYRTFIIQTLFQHLSKYEYRFCRRVLLFSQDAVRKELSRRMQGWCANRTAVKDSIQKDLLHTLNGYYSNTFIFFGADENQLNRNLLHATAIFESIGLPYVIEAKKYKDVWWGSLPGLFRANVMPPIQGVSNFGDFLLPNGKETLCIG